MIFAAVAGWAAAKEYPVAFMCEQLGVFASGYYKWRNGGDSARQTQDDALSALVQTLFEPLGKPGIRRLRAELRARGRPVGPVRLRRLMRRLGLSGRHPGQRKQTTIPGKKPVDAPDLVGRRFQAGKPNQKWCGDITYAKTWQGWAYLAAVIGLHSRALVGWAVSDKIDTPLVVAALKMALKNRRPRKGIIFHSDRGCQYTSKDFSGFCRGQGVRRSLGRTGSCFGNAVSESFNATYKKELIHTRPWPSVDALRKATSEWAEGYYNRTRRHSCLGCLTIQEYELGYRRLDDIASKTANRRCPL
ncbi:MAG: IS3 family transposase [Propionibacteriaceae bacterium]|nr:IS3 family transposase [Propionibacteriaceae bacterium]